MTTIYEENKILKSRLYKGVRFEVAGGVNNPFPYSIPSHAPAWFKTLEGVIKFIDDLERIN